MPQKLGDKPAEKGTIKAAGAVAWRLSPADGPEILLVHRAKYDDWSLPKGKAESGEPLPLTAVREVFEEGGASLAVGRRLIHTRYKVNGRPKRVCYWSARVTGIDDGAVPNAEVDEVAWLPLDQARARVTYSKDRDVLDDFAAAPADTVPLILLRHAKAEPKGDWPGEDAARPLSERGVRDAEALTALLACFAARAEVFTSPAVRCTETIRPYAEATGAPVHLAEELHFSLTDDPDSRAFLASVLDSPKPAILCAHRENLPGLIERVVTGLGVAELPPDAVDPLPTAAFLVLHVLAGDDAAAGMLVAVDRYCLSPAGDEGC
jgi:8-oxo-dGTP diphosphatase